MAIAVNAVRTQDDGNDLRRSTIFSSPRQLNGFARSLTARCYEPKRANACPKRFVDHRGTLTARCYRGDARPNILQAQVLSSDAILFAMRPLEIALTLVERFSKRVGNF
jgi:hypothetical protein